MISAFFTKILVALAAILGIVWLCAWLHEKGIRPLASLKKMSFVGLCAFMLWAAPFIQYGSTKGGGGTNNVPQLVIQPGTWLVPMASTNAQHQTATGEIQPMNQGVLAGMSVSESEQPALPITSTNTARTISPQTSSVVSSRRASERTKRSISLLRRMRQSSPTGGRSARRRTGSMSRSRTGRSRSGRTM